EHPDRSAVVIDPPEVVTAAGLRALARPQWGERPVEGQDVGAVAGQLQLADDLRSEKRDDVRVDAEAKPGKQLLGDRGAAEDVALLEDERLHPGPSQVGR